MRDPTLEHHLFPDGRIEIGSHGDYNFVAAFFRSGKQVVSVTSQNGVRHLLLLLEAELSHEKEKLLEAANERYPYYLSTQSITPLEIFLEHLHTIIFSAGPWVKIHCRTFCVPNNRGTIARPRLPGMPGEYELHEFGIAILDVFDLMMATPHFKKVEKK